MGAATEAKDILRNMELTAHERAEAAARAIAAADAGARGRILQDLKLTICQDAARLASFGPPDDLLWAMAADLPDFETASLYKTRASLLSLAAAVFLGWLLGGILATLLGFLGLGGEIWRPAAILGSLWLEDYLGSNPRARKVLLTVLGLGALGRLAAALAAGAARFGNLRSLIFGAGSRPNFFKTAWLWFGAFLLYVFFAKKITGLDISAFQHSLDAQIYERLRLMRLFFAELAHRQRRIDSMAAADAGRDASAQKRLDTLAASIMAALNSLDADHSRFLAGCLARAGYSQQDMDRDYIIWREDLADSYDTVGLASPGDNCLILRRPHEADGKLAKGLAQRVAQ